MALECCLHHVIETCKDSYMQQGVHYDHDAMTMMPCHWSIQIMAFPYIEVTHLCLFSVFKAVM